MKFQRPILIAGYGSIGRRHLRNLQTLGHRNFVIYRTGKSTLPESEIASIPIEYDIDKAFVHKPIATIVSNPTALHMPVALAAARAGSHLFLEKPISHNLDGVEELVAVAKKKNLIVQIGFQFRFHPGLKKIKRLLENGKIGKIVSAQAHWGEYLPDWHPWEDYRQSYSARADLGGGVLLTLCHPFDYLRWFFGEIESVKAQVSPDSVLNLNVEESADVFLKFKSSINGSVHLDYLQKPSEHSLRIIGTDGTILWNSSESGNFDRNTMFIDEMRHFLFCIKSKKQPVCTLADGIAALRIVLAAKKYNQNLICL